MPETRQGVAQRGPAVFTIPVHRNFADALVNGLLAQFGEDRLALARGLILVPNNRTVRAITDAFVRRAAAGLLLPRMVAVGEVGEYAVGLALDPAGGATLKAPVAPLVRRFAMARLLQQARAEMRNPVDAAEAVRLATDLAATLDTLLADDIAPTALKTLDVGAELSIHWQKSLDLIAILLHRWPEELARLDRIDVVARNNILLRRQARAWSEAPPPGFVVAAGVTTSVKAVAELLHVVARLPNGSVVLPGLDIYSTDDEWEVIASSASEGHPQHHLRLLLDRIAVARSDVKRWRWGDGKVRQAQRARSVSNAFAPARFTAKWNALTPRFRSLPGVRIAEFATPADEAQGVAIALREALETPGRTAALVTPDRALAQRVVAHLKRWGVDADDSGGRPLGVTPAGTLIRSVVEVAESGFAPVALLSLLKHPLVDAGRDRQEWLRGVRALDLALRGPRPAPGLAGLAAHLAAGDVWTRQIGKIAEAWWTDVSPLFEPIERAFAPAHPEFAALVEAVRETVAVLAGDHAWDGAAGRAASDLLAALATAAVEAPLDFESKALAPLFDQLMSEIAVRPPQGGHPRIAIWGLLEARLQSADLLICGGLNEGVWPPGATPDPWLAPKVRLELGLGGLDRRVGLSAHDLATALGGREVLLTRARRDMRAPTISSRFILRLEAMLGGIDADDRVVNLAQNIDAADAKPQLAARPAPSPSVEMRPKMISVTDVDRLRADPFAFYARQILRLSALDAVDADPGPAWRGTIVHAIFDRWFREDGLDPARLADRVADLFDDPAMHPVTRALWQPRLVRAIDWIAGQVAHDAALGRHVIESECKGAIAYAGITLKGIADRIDQSDRGLAIVDYKTGKPPSPKAINAGFANQLGLLGLIAARGGFPDVAGDPADFEYWSLAKDGDSFGKRSVLKHPDIVATAAANLTSTALKWLTGSEPFVAKLQPEYAPYAEYDQLMRLGEWYGRES